MHELEQRPVNTPGMLEIRIFELHRIDRDIVHEIAYETSDNLVAVPSEQLKPGIVNVKYISGDIQRLVGERRIFV